MFDLVGKRRWYFLFSTFLIVPGLIVMIFSTVTTGAPFRLGIDFVSGTIYDLTFVDEGVTESGIRDAFSAVGEENVVVQRVGTTNIRWAINELDFDDQNAGIAALSDAFAASVLGGDLAISFNDFNEAYILTFDDESVTEAQLRETFSDVLTDETTITRQTVTRWSVRSGEFQSPELLDEVLGELNQIAPIDESAFSFEAVSPSVGQEVTRAAFFAVLTAAFVITSFIVIAFWQVPNRLRYGLCAIAAMVHDVLIVMGLMSLLGLLLGWEVDALFLTAVLTVVGFSVQDSIVVFDRIRENIPRRIGEPYETIVNRSLWETIHRSLATQLNAFFIMIAILLFGGDTIFQFIFVLFIGLVSGSYSSLFTAVPLLVAWEKGEIPFLSGEGDLAEA